MVGNETINSTITLPADKTVNLNLNNSAINFNPSTDISLFIINGKMTIDSKTNGKITAKNKMMQVGANGYLKVKNGKFIGTQDTYNANANIMVIVSGKMDIDNGYFEGNNLWTIGATSANGLITVNKGEIVSKKGYALVSGTKSKVIVNGGKIHLVNNTNYGAALAAIASGGNIIVNGGDVYAETAGRAAYAYGSYSTLTVNGGHFYNKTSSDAMLASVQGGNVIVNNGTFESNSANAAVIAADTTSKININGGKFVGKSKFTVAANGSSKITITDKKARVYIGSIYNEPNNVWANTAVVSRDASTISISGHKANICNATPGVNNRGICIYSYNRTVLNEVNATNPIYINGATIVSDNKFALSTYTGVINVNNADIISKNMGIGMTVNENNKNPEKGIINICNSTIDGKSNDIYLNTIGYVRYNSNVVLKNNKVYDLANKPTHITKNASLKCS